MKSYVVIGLGRFGSRLAKQLYQNKAEVLAIDAHAAPVEQIADHVTQAIQADATEKDVLKSIGVQDCDCGIVAMASDLAASVLITMHLKALGVKEVICKAYDETHREILEKIGADRVITPEYEMADKLAISMTVPDVLDYIELSDEYGVAEVETPDQWLGQSLKELNIRALYGINILAIRRGEKIVVSPKAEEVLQQDDILVILGEYSTMDRLKRVRKR